MAKTETREKPSTSGGTKMTQQDAPAVVASMLQQLSRLDFVAHVGNSRTRPGELVVYIANMAVCERHHIYGLPGPCPDCATSGTGEVQDVNQ